jgi:hypothetical protein
MRHIRPALLGLALLGLCAAATSKPAAEVLPFIHDDYPKALAEAQARGVPIFIEASAPW